MTNLFNYIDRPSPIHRLTGASKLLFLVLLKLTRFQGTIHFAFHWKAAGNTVVLFAVIFLINYLKSLHQIHAAQPIELLHGEQEGEREPKTKMLTGRRSF